MCVAQGITNEINQPINQKTIKEANPMWNQKTLTQLRSLKLAGMGDALQEQLTQPSMSALSFAERLAMLVDWEVARMIAGVPGC